MTELSEMLKRYIHEKNIPVASLIHHLQIDRSTIYKYINGKRTPSLEHVEKLAGSMALTPREHQDFLEAYHITKLGSELYFRRKCVENFILTFPQPSREHRSFGNPFTGTDTDRHSHTAITPPQKLLGPCTLLWR